MPRQGPRYSETDARAAIEAARSWTDALRRLGERPAGGNHATLKKYAVAWNISVEHFDMGGAGPPYRTAAPLVAVLVERSTYDRRNLKRRLLDEGIKQRRCELCGQGETWRGERMALVLDHINGIWNDNRIENLRILCPNCNATLDTHCGRKNRRTLVDRECAYCGESFSPKYRRQRFCSRPCGVRHNAPALRTVERPPYEQLLAELAASSYLAVGRKYGVSDNAIRKWVRAYERERSPPERSLPLAA
jgi:HNH endonuclease